MKNVMLYSNYCCVTSISNVFPFFRLRVIPLPHQYAHTQRHTTRTHTHTPKEENGPSLNVYILEEFLSQNCLLCNVLTAMLKYCLDSDAVHAQESSKPVVGKE